MLTFIKKILLGLDGLLERIDTKIPKRLKVLALVTVFASLTLLFARYVTTHQIAVLSPRGLIANKQRNLLAFAAGLSLIVVIPVFIMTFGFAWKYREDNTKARYAPDWDHNRTAETIWWGVPLILILILSIVTWNSSHALDPFKPIGSSTPPITVQVVALQWKWLFIYPGQHVATVNYLVIPEKTPINFEITSDAPMNSFWIPQLGGQVYAMSGMSTKLHLMADQTGIFNGSSANISGEGFAGMHFTAQSVTHEEFRTWAKNTADFSETLDSSSYLMLAEPSLNNPKNTYRLASSDLYTGVVMKFTDPAEHDTIIEHNHSHINYGASQ